MTTWLRVSASGFNNTGFIRTSAATPAACACSHWAVPISPPSTTRALFDMFCALKGATSAPRRRSHRHSAVAIRLLPASLDTPCTMIVATARHPPTATGPIGSYQSAAPATSPAEQREPSGQAHSEHAQHPPYVAPPNLSDCQATQWLRDVHAALHPGRLPRHRRAPPYGSSDEPHRGALEWILC